MNVAHGSLYLDDYREFNGGAVVTPDEQLNFGYDALDCLLRGLVQSLEPWSDFVLENWG